MRLLFLLILVAPPPALARTWFSRTCGRLIGRRAIAATPEMHVAFARTEEELSRINRFSSQRLNVSLKRVDFLEDAPWAVVVEGRHGLVYATAPGEWIARSSPVGLFAMRFEALEIKRRNPEIVFAVGSNANELWLEGDLSEAQRTRLMLVMLQYAMEKI